MLIFLGSYIVLSVFYDWYLDISPFKNFYPDFFTYLVSKQSASVIDFLGYPARIITYKNGPAIHLLINNRFMASIVEGCNSLSVLILFVSFILAFFAKFKPTFFYILAGTVIIYVMNLVRIAILTIGIYEYPQYTVILHSIVFPLMIYGTVFFLWIFWVRLYTNITAGEKTL